MQAAGAEAMGKAMIEIGETLGVEAPSQAACANYLRLLGSIKIGQLRAVVDHILLTHKYNTFPRPADFQAAMQAVDGKWMVNYNRARLRALELQVGRRIGGEI